MGGGRHGGRGHGLEAGVRVAAGAASQVDRLPLAHGRRAHRAQLHHLRRVPLPRQPVAAVCALPLLRRPLHLLHPRPVGELRRERSEASGRHGDLVARSHDASRRLRSRSCRYPAPQLHSRPVPGYQERGLLVRAGLFIMEPMRWISQYGYRQMTTSECVANFVVWRDYGVRMAIKDIPEGIEELQEWQLKYEADQIVYADTNRKIADLTVALLLGQYPRLLWPLMRLLIFAMLDDRLREAFGYPEQPQWLRKLAKASLKHVHGTCVAVFLPPRPLSWAVNRIFVDVNEDGASFDVNKPRKLAFDLYGSSYPDGYKLSEVGPGKPGALGSVFCCVRPPSATSKLHGLLALVVLVHPATRHRACESHLLHFVRS